MSQQQEYLILMGMVSGLPDEEQEKFRAARDIIEAAIDDVVAIYGDAGTIAVMAAVGKMALDNE